MSIYWSGDTRKHDSMARKVDDRPPLSIGAAIALGVLVSAMLAVGLAVIVGMFA